MENNYQFTAYFFKVFASRTGLELTEDNKALILSVCQNTEPHKKIDNKGRYSEYFTFRIENKLITIVCDAKTKKIVTCILETHRRPQFDNCAVC